MMEIVPIELFGAAIEAPFAGPMAYGQAQIEEFGTKLCDPASGIGLRPDQIRLRRTDDLFDYELSARFFGENGWLTRTADRVKLGVRNARTAADWTIIRDTLRKFYTIADPPKTTVSMLSTHAHAKFSSAEERDQWLSRFAYSPLIARPAALGYVRIVGWEKDIRVMIEQSNACPGGVFVAWDTQFTNDQEWESFLARLPEMMENSANLFDLGFEPLRERL